VPWIYLLYHQHDRRWALPGSRRAHRGSA